MTVKKRFNHITKMACAGGHRDGGAERGRQCGTAIAATSSSNPYHLIQPGTLTVGMDLVFKPEMYLSPAGKPAGYDVALLNKLAAAMHLKLKIDNLDFTGLIPGLEAKKFDMVSVGLSPTPRGKRPFLSAGPTFLMR